MKVINNMALDPLVVLCPPLQEVILDKDSGEPLTNGTVTFYEDSNRTVLKPIYTINGNGPYSDASYVQLPNPLYLSSIGSFVDNNGNDIIPYLFPYDGVPGDTDGSIDLYYVVVQSSGGVLQFTREAWPNIGGSGSPVNGNDVINYVPNGQFLLHNDNPVKTNITTAVPASADVSYIAQGGWTFKVPHLTASVNTVSFVRQNIPATNPDVSADPRYVLDVECTSPSNVDTFKDIALEFPDVNKFATSTLENNYTFSFQAVSLTGSPLPVQVRLLKYFGSGGSPSVATDTPFGVGVLTIGTSSNIYNIQGLFGTNAGKVLGTDDNDYLQIVIRLPNTVSHIQISDVVLTNGAVTLTAFPQTPNSDFLDRSIPGWLPTPNPDGSDMYLPIVITPQGAIADRSYVGKIYAVPYYTPQNGELLCDGTMYDTQGYSALGIPYYRLQNVLFDANPSVEMPVFGTGQYFVSTYVSTGSTSTIRVTTNTTGSVTVPANGAVSPGFSFATIATGSNYGFTGYSSTSTSITVIANVIGAAFGVLSAGTSGFTVGQVRNSATQYQAFSVIGILAASGLNNKYFRFSNTTTQYYIWFNVNGGGVDPAPGGTGIQVHLISTYSATDVAGAIREAISGYQVTGITVTSAATIPQSSYWTFQTNTASSTQNYYTWYSINNGGIDPAVTNAIGIEVDILSTDTAPQVATKTMIALNSRYFAVPDLRGMFIRGWDSGSLWDYSAGTRFTQVESLAGSQIGTYEYDGILAHTHSVTASGTVNAATSVDPAGPPTFLVDARTPSGTQAINVSGTTGSTGNPETTVFNIALNYVIKY